MKQLFESSEKSKNRTLRFSELLNINGGYSGSSGGKRKNNTSPNNTAGNSGNSEKSSYSSPCIAAAPSNKERLSVIKGRAYSSLSGFITGYPDISSEDWDTQKVTMPDIKTISPNAKTPEFIQNEIGDTSINITKKIAETIAKDMKKGNIVYGKDEIRCDNYVQSLLKDCGVKYEKYFAGAADKYTVSQHIANLNKNKNYDSSVVEKGNSYVVFMSGKKTLSDGTVTNYAPHCGILTVAANGNCYLTDNSSGNKMGNGNEGGLGVTYGKSISEVQSQFAYSNFYYQKIV